MTSIFRLASAFVLLGSCFALGDWPQFRGPGSDGISPEPMVFPWPADGPPLLWKKDVKDGFGSFAIRGGKAYFLLQTDGAESCCAVELRSGNLVWATKLDKTILQSTGGIGPRSTPTLVDGKVYAFGTYLKLACLNADDGKIVWQHDLAREYHGQLGTRGIREYGSACSPVVEGDLVIVNGGGSGEAFLAFNKNTGDVAWKTQDDLITHATPTPATLGGVRQVVFFTKTGMASVEAKTGQLLWRYAMPSQQPACASPVVSGDIVYCSAGYGVGAAACRISKDGDKFTVTESGARGRNMNHFSTPVCKDGYLYGLYGSMQQNNAPLECVELATGKRMWSEPDFGEGEVILVGGKLVVQNSRGLLVLAEATPTGYKELSRARVIAGRAWGFPAYSEGVLLFRTDKQIAALDLKRPE